MAARLELMGPRAHAFFGVNKAGTGARTESTGGKSGLPNDTDAVRIATRIQAELSLDAAAALAIAREMVGQARTALDRKHPTEAEVLSLEAVIHVRGRPALRVMKDHLESLQNFPGSEFWQDFITEYEGRIVAAAAVTGGILVDAFETGNPRWLQGSGWLISPNRVVTNRHVLLPGTGVKLIELGTDDRNAQLRQGFTLTVEFAADNRAPAASISRRVTNVLYVSKPADHVDIAVLEIESYSGVQTLALADDYADTPKNLYVVGHPALATAVPDQVKSVFGNPDGAKRVSFGQLLSVTQNGNTILYDASTTGGYSGGPVVGIASGRVAGLHYYGDASVGNYAVTARGLREHPAFPCLLGTA